MLLLVLTDEIARRDSAAADTRARVAGLDDAMRLDLWDKTSKVSFNKRMLAELSARRSYRKHSTISPAGTVTTCASCALMRCCARCVRVGSTTHATPKWLP